MIRYIRLRRNKDGSYTSDCLEQFSKYAETVTGAISFKNVMDNILEPYSIKSVFRRTTDDGFQVIRHLSIEVSKEQLTLLLLGTSNLTFFEIISKKDCIKND